MKHTRKGISNVIALILIVAVALIISVAVAYYLISVVTPIYEKGAETLMIKGDSYITKNGNTYVARVHLYSNIKPALTIYAVEIGSIYIRLNVSSANIVAYNGGSAELTNKGLTLTPGTDVWIELQVSDNLNIGNFIEIK
ncbi:MAG: hypothetical protein J7L12_04780, partial [Desulfurococcales archaeon]|nr:hypothetical protein [Desulfurococcales archaeon]